VKYFSGLSASIDVNSQFLLSDGATSLVPAYKDKADFDQLLSAENLSADFTNGKTAFPLTNRSGRTTAPQELTGNLTQNSLTLSQRSGGRKFIFAVTISI